MTTLDPQSISPELTYLIECASLASDTHKTIRVTGINDNEIDEEKLIEMAGRHGVRALVTRYRNLKDESQARISILNTQSNLQMTGELIRILGRFNRESIRVIPYKGPTLADLAYGDLGLREFGDLDLLIEEKSFLTAHRLMLVDGYEPEIDLKTSQWRSFMATTNVLAYWHPIKDITVELHWELSPRYLPFPVDFETLYLRREPSHPGGREVMTMSPGDLLLYLCMHGAKHCWERLSWIIDVGGLVRRQQRIDWERMIEEARVGGCDRVLGLGMLLARNVTGFELPATAERMIEGDPEIPGLFVQVIEWLDRDEPISLMAKTKFLLRLQQSTMGKVRMLYWIMATPSVADWRLISLPGTLTWWYRLIRLLRLMRAAIS